MDEAFMRQALRLARHGYGRTSPNPMVGAVLVKSGVIIGRGWHHRAGEPHGEIEAMRDAQRRGCDVRGAILYVTLEPCCTHGRTPPCTRAIANAGIRRVVIGALDPNPRHRGRALRILPRAGVSVVAGVLEEPCRRLNEAFNHWIVQGTPWVTVKAAMTLDGKIATPSGESKWITGEQARACAMRLREGADAILIGINTLLADNPSLTLRGRANAGPKRLRRIILDAQARTPLTAKVVTDQHAALTTIIVTQAAPRSRIAALSKRVNLLVAPAQRRAPPQPVEPKAAFGQKSPAVLQERIDLGWLLKKLGEEEVTNLLVEGGGEVNADFLMPGLAHRIAFFYAPKIIGGRNAYRGVAGPGAESWEQSLDLADVAWRRLGPDWLLTAQVVSSAAAHRK